MAAETRQPAAGAPSVEKAGQEKVGEVVSTKMAKTIVVEVIRRVKHPLYRRVVSKRRKFYAHDEDQSARVGDVVRIVEHRPLSRLKRWALADVIRKAVIVEETVAQAKAAAAKNAETKGKKKA